MVALDATRAPCWSGERQRFDLKHLTYRYFRPGWVQTIHAAQATTADRAMAHLESFRTNTVDTRAAYVAVSRARSHTALYTNSRARLAKALGLRDGARVGAIDEIMGVTLNANTIPSSGLQM